MDINNKRYLGGGRVLKKLFSCILLIFMSIAMSSTAVLADVPIRTLYAKWRPITYSISYDLDGGHLKDGEMNPTTYTIEDSFTLKAPEKKDYVFTGWTGSNGATPQTSVTVSGDIGDKSYAANWEEEIDIPHSDDPYAKIDDIKEFIKTYKGTPLQIGFQGDGNGNFYVKAGSFTNGSNPDLAASGGKLIYKASKDMGSEIDNYRCAAHLANVMNYILYKCKGSSYGYDKGSSKEFGDDAEVKSSGCASSQDTSINGFGYAHGDDSYFVCYGQSYTGYYNYYNVRSSSYNAVWW